MNKKYRYARVLVKVTGSWFQVVINNNLYNDRWFACATNNDIGTSTLNNRPLSLDFNNLWRNVA